MTRAVNIALIVIAAFFVSIRFLSRWRGQGANTLGWDDWTILASFLLLIPSTTILQISTFRFHSASSLPCTDLPPIVTYTGLGRDIWTVEFDNITLMFKVCSMQPVLSPNSFRHLTILSSCSQYFYFDQYIYQLIIVLTKISIVLLYLRIFPKAVSPRFSYVSWAIIAGLLAYCASFLIYCG